MIHVQQYFPNFFSGFTPEEADVNNLEELLKIKFVNRWYNLPNFSKFSLGRSKYLMVELKDNSYWVIGFLSGDVENLQLPKWVK